MMDEEENEYTSMFCELSTMLVGAMLIHVGQKVARCSNQTFVLLNPITLLQDRNGHICNCSI